MLQPKRTKFRKKQKGRVKGIAQRGHTINFGSFQKKFDVKAFISVNHVFITLGIISFEEIFTCVVCIFTILKKN